MDRSASNSSFNNERPSSATLVANGTQASSLLQKLYHSKRIRIFLIIVIIAIGFLSNHNKSTTSFLVWGGCIGAISSAAVMLDILANRRDGAMLLLFWRAFADFGVAVRFLATYPLNHIACGQENCYLPTDDIYSSNCGFPSAFLEFFEIASEMWFLCIAIDLWKSLINPFSSTKSWMPTYHVVVWVTSSAFALPTGLLESLHGYWFIANNVDNTAICWISFHKGSVSPYVYIMFYIPLILVYIVACISVVVAYRKLRHGISSTIVHRMKALVTNGINVIVYMLYWGLLGLILTLAYVIGNTTGERWMLRLLLYLISAKGVTASIVWVLTVDVHFTNEDGDRHGDDDGVDLNGALRQELMYFATTGIRTSASNSSQLQPLQSKLAIKIKRIEKSHVGLSPLFFLNLILGREQEKRKIAAIASAARRKGQTRMLTELLKPQTTAEFDRFSQRTTMPFMPKPAIPITKSALDSEFGIPDDVRDDGHDDNRDSTASARPSEAATVTNFSEIRRANISSLWQWIADFWQKAFSDGLEDVEFVEDEPYHFQRIRQTQDIDDSDYVEQFRTTIKERVTQGGASGAFFFFSRDEKFIAKSCTPSEFAVLTSNAKKLADYFESDAGQNSYISKVYGAYTMHIYGISLHFFVMNNLFYDKDEIGAGLSIHEKYDIKGSTVNRSSVPPSNGQTVTCTHCEQKFVYYRRKKNKKKALKGLNNSNDSPIRNSILNLGTSINQSNLDELDDSENRCIVTVSGEHEPNVIMKDNDLKYKFRLPRGVAKDLMAQLENDAHFLFGIGVMDYSLLVGVHNTEYEVRPDTPTLQEGSKLRYMPKSNSSSASEAEGIMMTVRSPIGAASTSTRSDGLSTSSAIKSKKSSRRLEVSRVVGPDTYIMGIIDFQQQWNFSKKLERFFKVQIKGEDAYGLSAIAPDIYRDRFISHIRDILDVDDDKSSRNPSNSSV